MKGVKLFIQNSRNYVFFFDNIGPVKIHSAALENGELAISYAYFDSGENRTGFTKGKLEDNHYVGIWETRADSGNIYSGRNRFDFAHDGSASGSWGMGMDQTSFKMSIKFCNE